MDMIKQKDPQETKVSVEMTSTKQRGRSRQRKAQCALNTPFTPIKLCFTARTAGVHVSYSATPRPPALYGLYKKLKLQLSIYYSPVTPYCPHDYTRLPPLKNSFQASQWKPFEAEEERKSIQGQTQKESVRGMEKVHDHHIYFNT